MNNKQNALALKKALEEAINHPIESCVAIGNFADCEAGFALSSGDAISKAGLIKSLLDRESEVALLLAMMLDSKTFKEQLLGGTNND